MADDDLGKGIYKTLRKTHVRQLFAEDPKTKVKDEGVWVDVQRIDEIEINHRPDNQTYTYHPKWHDADGKENPNREKVKVKNPDNNEQFVEVPAMHRSDWGVSPYLSAREFGKSEIDGPEASTPLLNDQWWTGQAEGLHFYLPPEDEERAGHTLAEETTRYADIRRVIHRDVEAEPDKDGFFEKGAYKLVEDKDGGDKLKDRDQYVNFEFPLRVTIRDTAQRLYQINYLNLNQKYLLEFFEPMDAKDMKDEKKKPTWLDPFQNIINVQWGAGVFIIGDSSGYVWYSEMKTTDAEPTLELVGQIGVEEFDPENDDRTVGSISSASYGLVKKSADDPGRATFLVCGVDYQDTGEGFYIDGRILLSHDGKNWQTALEFVGSQFSEWGITEQLVWDEEDQKFYAWIVHRSAVQISPPVDFTYWGECWASSDGYDWEMIDQVEYPPGDISPRINPVFESHCKWKWSEASGTMEGRGLADGQFGFNTSLTTFEPPPAPPLGKIATDPEDPEIKGHLITVEDFIYGDSITFRNGIWGRGDQERFMVSTDDGRTWKYEGSVAQTDSPPRGTGINVVIAGDRGAVKREQGG